MKCPICNRDFPKGWRSVHAHMLKDHLEEYRKKGCKLSAYGMTINQDFERAVQEMEAGTKPKAKIEPKGKGKPIKKKSTPDDFRPLDRSDQEEAEAYAEGYRYYSGGNAYTSAECKEMGWM